jgi:hypothetical protein
VKVNLGGISAALFEAKCSVMCVERLRMRVMTEREGLSSRIGHHFPG